MKHPLNKSSFLLEIPVLQNVAFVVSPELAKYPGLAHDD